MQHRLLDQWIQEAAALCRPNTIHYCDGSLQEYQLLCKKMVDQGTMFPLNPQLRPNSFLCLSDPQDVARVEDRTFICSATKEEAGPTNHWRDPVEMKKKLR